MGSTRKPKTLPARIEWSPRPMTKFEKLQWEQQQRASNPLPRWTKAADSIRGLLDGMQWQNPSPSPVPSKAAYSSVSKPVHQSSPTAGVSLSQACAEFVAMRDWSGHAFAEQMLLRFSRFCGRGLPLGLLTPLVVESYCATLKRAGDERYQHVEIIRAFLNYLYAQGLIQGSLSEHARIRQQDTILSTTNRKRKVEPAISRITPEGKLRLEEELASLKAKRSDMVHMISGGRGTVAKRVMRNNAPWDAAREEQGHLEKRILEIETALRSAEIVDKTDPAEALIVTMGSCVELLNTKSHQEVIFSLVDSSEANPAAGRISGTSPLGKALLDKTVGDEVVVITPRGPARYLVSKIGY